MGYILKDESNLNPGTQLTQIESSPMTLQEAVTRTVQYVLAYTQVPDTERLAKYIREGFFSKEEMYGISLNMLLDLPVTATIVYDIVNTNFPSSQEGTNNTILDLGTGTGILGFAGFLNLRRHKKNPQIIGVENHPLVAQRTHRFFQKIGAGIAVHADSEENDLIQILGIAPEQVKWIMNENLGQPGKHVHQEPFLSNLWNLRKSSFTFQGATHMFPYGITIENCGTQTLPPSLCPENNFGGILDQEGTTFKHPSIIWKKLKSNPNGSFHRVGGIGTEYYGNRARKFFEPDILRYLPSRWVDYTRD